MEPNRGQTDPSVRYLIRNGDSSVFVTDRETIVAFAASDAALRWTHPGSSAPAEYEPGERGDVTANYLQGRDQSKWVRDLPTYKRLLRRDLYPGIDLQYRAGGPVEYDYVVHPGADPSRIRLRFAPRTRLRILADGSLDSESGGRRLRHKTPVAFTADNARVPVRFARLGPREVGFTVGKYDRAQTLTIDPELMSLDFSGGFLDDQLTAASADGRIRAGTTTSPDFPGSGIGARGDTDILVQVFNGNSTSVFVIGGSGQDTPLGVAQFRQGILVVGETNSRDLPTASGAFQAEYGGGSSDGFVLCLLNGGAGFRWISYYGGSGADRIKRVTNATTVAAFAGETDSEDLPGLAGYQQRLFGQADAFLMLDAALATSVDPMRPSGLRIFGGSGNDYVGALEAQFVLGSGAANTLLTLAGETESPDFAGPQTLQGLSDAYVLRLTLGDLQTDPDFVQMWGGAGRDRFLSIQLAGGQPLRYILSGESDSPALPGIDASEARGGTDIVQVILDPAGMTWDRGWRWGGSGEERLLGVAGLGDGSLVVTGQTTSRDLPTVAPIQSEYGGGPSDGFVIARKATGETQLASYLGGGQSDAVTGACSFCLRIDTAVGLGDFTVFGWTDSPAFVGARLLENAPVLRTNGSAGSDWFFARVLLSRAPTSYNVDLAPGMLTPFSVFSPARIPSGALAAFTVADPSVARLTKERSLRGGGATAQMNLDSAADQVWAYPVGPSGETSVRLEVPGLGVTELPVRVGRLRASFGALSRQTAPVVSSGPIFLQPSIDFVHETSAYTVFPSFSRLFPEWNGASWRVEILTPETVRFDQTTNSAVESPLDPSGRFTLQLAPLRPGPFRIRLSVSNSSVEPAELSGQIASAVQLVVIPRMPANTVITAGVLPARADTAVRVVSSDPSGILLSATANGETSAELRGTGSRSVFVHALRAGTYTLRAEPEGGQPVEAQITVLPLGVGFSPPLARDMSPGVEALPGTVQIGAVDSDGRIVFSGGSLRPGVTLRVPISADAGSGIQLRERELTIAAPASLANVSATATLAGRFAIRIGEVTGAAVPSSRASLEINVRDRDRIEAPLVVGVNLTRRVTMPVPLSADRARQGFRIVSANPDRVLLSTFNSPPGPAAVFPPGSTNNIDMNLHGVAAGDVPLRVEVAGADQPPGLRARVFPVGYLVGEVSTTANLNPGERTAFRISLHPIDPETGLPGSGQEWRSTVAAPEPRVSVDNPAVVSVSVARNPGSESTWQIDVQALSVGKARLRIVQPAGFVESRIRQVAEVSVAGGGTNAAIAR